MPNLSLLIGALLCVALFWRFRASSCIEKYFGLIPHEDVVNIYPYEQQLLNFCTTMMVFALGLSFTPKWPHSVAIVFSSASTYALTRVVGRWQIPKDVDTLGVTEDYPYIYGVNHFGVCWVLQDQDGYNKALWLAFNFPIACAAFFGVLVSLLAHIIVKEYGAEAITEEKRKFLVETRNAAITQAITAITVFALFFFQAQSTVNGSGWESCTRMSSCFFVTILLFNEASDCFREG